jgi:hypothetical protein
VKFKIDMAMLVKLLLRVIAGIVVCFIAVSFSALFGLIMVFFPFALILAFANQRNEKAEITKAYKILMRRYYENQLFQNEFNN